MKQALAPLSAAVCIPLAGVVAWLLDADVALTVAGAGLGLLYALLDLGASLLAARGSFAYSIAVGVGGMVARLAVILAAMSVIGLLTTREQTLTAILAFVAVFTVSLAVRLAVTPSLVGGTAQDARPTRTAARIVPPDQTRPSGRSTRP